MELDAPMSRPEMTQPPPISIEIPGASPKTSLRLTYEAQAQVIQKQLGGLVGVQAALGISGRKICQLLMIDPSAWPRWMKTGQNPPPAVWRALQWYMILQEKIPGLTPAYFVGRDGKTQITEMELKILSLEKLILQSDRRMKKLAGICFGAGVLLGIFLFIRLHS